MRTMLALVVLIVVGVGLAAYTATLRPYNATPPPGDPAAIEAEQKKAVEDAKAALLKSQNPLFKGVAREKRFDLVQEKKVRAVMEIEGRGAMTLELYPKAAPKTVEHFVELAKKGFYDGLKFHRVEPGIEANKIGVVQGGDPNSKGLDPSKFESSQIGTHGSGKTVPLESGLPHLPYTVGLARSGSPDSGDSQFYINLKDNTPLDDGYCVFGKVVQGEDIASKIQIGDTIKSLKVE